MARLEKKPGDTFVYCNFRNKLGASAIRINRTKIGRLIKGRDSGVKETRVQRSSAGKGPASAVPEVKNETALMDVVWDDTGVMVVNADTLILNSALTGYFDLFRCLYQ